MQSDESSPGSDKVQIFIRTTPEIKKAVEELALLSGASVNEFLNSYLANLATVAGMKMDRSYRVKYVATKLGVHPETIKLWLKKYPELPVENRGTRAMRIPHATFEKLRQYHTS
jgi:transposase-like protein